MSGRTEELAANLASLRSRIDAARAAAGRTDQVTLVAITKTFPAEDVRRLAGLGIEQVGENRHQEAVAKAAALADLGLRWHFVGQLQRNKARAVASYADVVQSLDRESLVTALDRAAAERGRALRVLVQVDLRDHEGDGRGGARPEQVGALADLVAGSAALELAGVMAVAPLGQDPAPAFARLWEVSVRLRRDHPGAGWVSAGMSQDLEAAVAAGATHLRIGSALLGHRPPLR
ncbi:MAG TPA: YggS family pyridoxal phosphate-dependent enzyme [Candidatus Nanopelagicales bacterium]|nr:YggS family pyridoxal phosphate-dependent enzyme [Candidatus Nanopelagicales bacterium]